MHVARDTGAHDWRPVPCARTISAVIFSTTLADLVMLLCHDLASFWSYPARSTPGAPQSGRDRTVGIRTDGSIEGGVESWD